MYLDALHRVWNATALTATAVSDAIDTGDLTIARHIATGEQLGYLLTVDVAADFTSANETYVFGIISDGDSALGSPTVHATFTRAAADLTAGARFIFACPQGPPTYERYWGLQATLGGTTPSVTVTAYLSLLSMLSIEPRHYADAITP